MRRIITVGLVLAATFAGSFGPARGAVPAAHATAALPTPTVTLTPSTGLVPGRLVALAARSFHPRDNLTFRECVTDYQGAPYCDPSMRSASGTDDVGTTYADFSVARHLVSPSGSFDCATALGACSLAWSSTFGDAGTIPLGFDASVDTHPTVTVTPSTNLADGQSVVVAGSGYEADSLITIEQCVAGPGTECATLATIGRPGASGSFSTTVSVHRLVVAGLHPVDCAAPAACEIRAAGEMSADHVARSSVAFASSGPAPTVPSLTVTPATGLRDGQSLTVTAAHVDPNAFSDIALCVGTHDVSECGAPVIVTHADANGVIAASLAAQRIVKDPRTNRTVDCANVACGIRAYSTSAHRLVLLIAAIAFDPSVPPPPTPTLTVSPAAHLTDGASAHVRGVGFTPGRALIEQCAGPYECRYLSSFGFAIDADGTFDTDVTVYEFPGLFSQLDCADPTMGCVIRVTDSRFVVAVPITFAGTPRPKVALTVSPASSLGDRQTIAVRVTGLSPGGQVLAEECMAGQYGDGGCVDLGTHIADSTGVIDFTTMARRRLATPDFSCKPASVGRAGSRAVRPRPHDPCKPGRKAPLGFMDCIDMNAHCEILVDVWNGTSSGPQVSAALGFDPSAPIAPLPRVSVTPSTGLVGGQTAHASGHGFWAGEWLELAVCEGPDPTTSWCDLLQTAYADANGDIELDVTVPRTIDHDDGSSTTCTGHSCWLAVYRYNGGDPQPVSTRLHFDENVAPPVVSAAVAPFDSLTDGHTVTVDATGFTAGESVSVAECVDGPQGAVCAPGSQQSLVADGTGRIHATTTVDQHVDTFYYVADSAAHAGSCFLSVAGYGLHHTIVPLYFGGPAPTLQITNGRFVEGATRRVGVPVTLDAPVSMPITVAYHMVGVTATAGSDFLARQGTITMPAGSTHATIPLGLLGDQIVEPTEQLQIVIDSVEGATPSHPSVTIAIRDDD